MPYVLLAGFDEGDDVLAIVRELLEHGERYTVGDAIVLSDRAERRRAQSRARQRKYRAASRSSVTDGNAAALRNGADDDDEFPADDPGYNRPRSEGAREVGYPGAVTDERYARDASRVTRHALPDAAQYRADVEPLTDDEREDAQRRIREMGDELRASRST